MDRPVKVLRDFKRVNLNPGEIKQVSLSFTKNSMSYFDEKTDEFVEENIGYIAYIGIVAVKKHCIRYHSGFDNKLFYIRR